MNSCHKQIIEGLTILSNSLRTTGLFLCFLALSIVLGSCSSLGTGRVPPDRFDYNQAIGQSANEQMLLNLVRLRYREVPVFLSISSVLSQYVYLGSANVSATSDSARGGIGFTYIDRPTITYSPLSGEEFAHQLLTPIPSESIFSLAQSGWPAAQLMMMGFERLNHIRNTVFNPVLNNEQIEQMKEFQLAVELIVELSKVNAMESISGDGKDQYSRYLVFEKNTDPETELLIQRFKDLLHLDPDLYTFRITTQQTNRKPDEITIRLRSLLTLMGFLAHGVEVPEEHAQEKVVELDSTVSSVAQNDYLVPLQIHSSESEPDDAFVAVEYQDYWFYIEHSDPVSKQAFGLVTYLYMLQAPQVPGSMPLITIPSG